MYKDKTIACKDCGTDFVFTSGEQEFFAQKGFDNEPVRCKECRDKKKANSRNSRGNNGQRGNRPRNNFSRQR